MESSEEVLQSLTALQAQPLSIIRLSEPLLSTSPLLNSPSSSGAGLQPPSPASLEADLNHYKDLFSKLRFSYLEQVTKEKFLRSIVGEPPLIVEPAENVELEAQLTEVKAVLKEQKARVAVMIQDLEARGRDLCRRHETITLQTTLLSTLPTQIASLESNISALHALPALNPSTSPSSDLSLPLPATLSLLAKRQAELADLEQQRKALQQVLPRKARALEKAEEESQQIEARWEEVAIGARDAVRRRAEGGGGNELENKGRWLTGVEAGLKEILGVEG